MTEKELHKKLLQYDQLQTSIKEQEKQKAELKEEIVPAINGLGGAVVIGDISAKVGKSKRIDAASSRVIERKLTPAERKLFEVTVLNITKERLEKLLPPQKSSKLLKLVPDTESLTVKSTAEEGVD